MSFHTIPPSNRYAELFAGVSPSRPPKKLAFCPFAVIGFPDERRSLVTVKQYIHLGADMLELGFPFSDPTADGPVLQTANKKALAEGMTVKKAFQFIKSVRKYVDKISKKPIPIGILVYFNLVYRYGITKFYQEARRVGADSVLIADVPLEESGKAVQAAKKAGIHLIFLVSERTSDKRLNALLKLASGFLYVVSTLGITGIRENLPKSLPHLLKKIRRQTNLPLMVGFGISNQNQIRALKNTSANGFIVGSALIGDDTNKLMTSLQRAASPMRIDNIKEPLKNVTL
ncbi:tryptophan synthase subunit alpha [Candidatus Peregrinibacteria bacterium]|nr:tryptophan synthase subunit alpha [Candidatus Peregrinibacteria bacterium]